MTPKRWTRGLAASALLLASISLVACGGGGTADPVTTPSGSPQSSGGTPGSNGGGSPGPVAAHAGMGGSTATPTGSPYAWPQGLQVEQPIKGDDPFCVPEDQHDKAHTGHGGLVRLCLAFRNTGAVPITVTLPPGLVFISDSLETQNGIVLQETVIVVPAGTATYYVPVWLYCLNLGRHNTAGEQDTYHTGPVTDDASVNELLSLLQGKQVPLAFEFSLQQALWHITDDTGLTPEDRQAIAGL